MVEVSLTVGKLDASLALLLTKDHHLIEFPTVLLPDGVNAGSVVTIKCEQDLDEEAKEKKVFNDVQEQILELFGKNEPKAPVLKVKNVTQTSAVLEWDPLDHGSASIKSLTLYKNNSRLGQIPNPLVNTTTKLSGLPVDTPYEFHLRLDTTAGVYQSEPVKLKTHKMTDLSGITVCIGEIDPNEGITRKDIEDSLANMGAKPLQDEVKVDTTHFICTLGLGPQYKKALDNNIPVVRPEWLKASETERRIIGVRNFYLDADPQNLEQHRFNKAQPPRPQPEAPNDESLAGTEGSKEVEDGTSNSTPAEEAPKQETLQEVPIESTPEEAEVNGNTVDAETVPESSPIAESSSVTETTGPVSSEPVAEEKIEISNPDEPSEVISESVESAAVETEPVESTAEESTSEETKEPLSQSEPTEVLPTEEPAVPESLEVAEQTEPIEAKIEEPVVESEKGLEEVDLTGSQPEESQSEEPKPEEPKLEPKLEEPKLEEPKLEEPKPEEAIGENGEAEDEDEGEDDADENDENGEAENKEQQPTSSSSQKKKKNKKKNKKKGKN